MSDDTPTQRFDAPATPPGGAAIAGGAANSGTAAIAGDEKKSRGLLIALIAVGGVLLIAVIILLIVLLGGGGKPVATATTTPLASDTPTTSSTPSATAIVTPSATPTATTAPPPPPPPPSTSPAIKSYSISPAQIDCSSGTPNLSIHWSSVNGAHAYFGVNTNDAMTGGMGWELPPTGSDADFPDGYRPYPALCGNDSTEYTITILGNDGTKVSKKFTVTKK